MCTRVWQELFGWLWTGEGTKQVSCRTKSRLPSVHGSGPGVASTVVTWKSGKTVSVQGKSDGLLFPLVPLVLSDEERTSDVDWVSSRVLSLLPPYNVYGRRNPHIYKVWLFAYTRVFLTTPLPDNKVTLSNRIPFPTFRDSASFRPSFSPYSASSDFTVRAPVHVTPSSFTPLSCLVGRPPNTRLVILPQSHPSL